MLARRGRGRRRKEGEVREGGMEGREIAEGEMFAGEIGKLSGTPKAGLASI